LGKVRRWLPRLAGLGLLLACGCATDTERGAGIGALGGGLLGAGIGAICHNPLAGAAIGAGAGGVGGAGVGSHSDAKKAEAAAVAASAPVVGPLGFVDIANMAHQHIADEIIINQIRSTGTVYHLRTEDIIWLREQGVSEPVIGEMQLTAARYPRHV